MPAATTPVLAYDRPLAPGSVRITRSDAAVAVTVAPDTPRRAVFSSVLPAGLLVLAGGVAALSFAAGEGRMYYGFIVSLVLAGVAAAILYETLRQSREPIVFTADPSILRVQNALETPPDRVVGVFEIESLRLGRHPPSAGAYHLEVWTRKLPGRPATVISLLASPSFETLDKIGRTLAEHMRLAVPAAVRDGWQTGGPAAPAATPSSPPAPSPGPPS